MHRSWARLRALFSRRHLDAELREEIDGHLRMEVEANLDRGMSPDDALSTARRTFGNPTQVQESSREAWMFIALETIWQDVRYGLRTLRRSRGFALTAVLVIALGIGATTAAFTLLDHVLLRPLPFADPERLVLLHQTDQNDGGSFELVSPPNFVDWRASGKSFDSMGSYMPAPLPVNLSGQGDPMRLDTTLATSDLFRTLGVQPAVGRGFTGDDDRDGAPNVVLLSHTLAVSLFGDAPTAVGRTLSLDNQSHTVVGVMPSGFMFPRADALLWRPLRLTQFLANRSNHILLAVGRLRADVSMREARAEMDVLADQLQRAYAKDNAKAGIAVVRLRDLMSPQSRTLVIAVFAAAFCLMLIACTNLAHLLFARAMVRKQEMAVRVAIGAARGRLLRQLLTESLVVAGLGGVLGAILAGTASPLLARLVPNGLPIGGTPQVDLRVFGFATFLTLTTSIAFGVGPALRSSRSANLDALRARSAGGGRTDRLRAALVVAEVAGTVTLLVGGGLLVKALWRVQALDPGFRAHGVLTLRTALPTPKYGDAVARRRFYARVLSEVQALPGVTHAAYTSYHPLEPFSGGREVLVPGVVDDPLTAPSGVAHFVTGDFFATLGVPILRGRSLSDSDDAAAAPVVVLSEALADQLFPGQDPIGRRVKVVGDRTVVGVAGNVTTRSLEGARYFQTYFPAEQMGTTPTYFSPKDLLIRASVDSTSLVPAVRRIVHDADPEQAISSVRLLEEIVAAQMAPRRDQLLVLGTFTAIAFLLAAVGIYGLLSFTVSARMTELGIRVALGAARRDILGMFLRQGLALGVGGIVVAVPMAYAAAQGMTTLLFGVPPGDPLIYAISSSLALAMTLAGTLGPALRAAAVDPATTIRAE
jgi:predicted permease